MNGIDFETYVDENKKIIVYCGVSIFRNELLINYIKDGIIVLELIKKMFEIMRKNELNEEFVYAHNLSSYDGFLIFEEISKSDDYKIIKEETLIADSKFYSLVISDGVRKIIFKCSYLILPLSLKKIAKGFNLNVIKGVFPYKFVTSEKINYKGRTPALEFYNKEDWNEVIIEENYDLKQKTIEYCKNDVEILVGFLTELRDMLKNFDININDFYSTPSISLKIYCKKFDKWGLKLRHEKNDVLNYRKSLYGGIVMVYGNPMENEKVYHFDFSGMYGISMKQHFPIINNLQYEKNPLNMGKFGIYNIDFYSNMNYPVLPIRDERNKLMFVNGTQSGWYWKEEIDYFIERGGIVLNIKECYAVDSMEKIFYDFVEFFTEYRKKSEAHKILGKLMINSLYGKLCSRNERNRDIVLNRKEYKNFYNKNKKKINREIKVNDLIWINLKIEDYKKIENNILLAGVITSKARITLQKAQQEVIESGGRLLYSDTDSIYAAYSSKINVKDIKLKSIDWNIETQDIEDAVFIGNKTYAIKRKNNEIVKLKGINAKIGFETLKNDFYLDKSYIKTKSNYAISKSNKFLYEKNQDKILDLKSYDKRIFTKDKKNTTPLNSLSH